MSKSKSVQSTRPISAAKTSKLMQSDTYIMLTKAGVPSNKAIIFTDIARKKPILIQDFTDALDEKTHSALEIVEILLEIELGTKKLLSKTTLDSPPNAVIHNIMKRAENEDVEDEDLFEENVILFPPREMEELIDNISQQES